jgi:hypothetical protein
MVRYRLQTLILAEREAPATGGGSSAPSEFSVGGLMSGRRVDRASGSRRVRNNCDAWRYVLVTCEECRALFAEESDDMEDERTCEGKRGEGSAGLAGLKVAV